MTTATSEQTPSEEATAAGSYFVSNYPPFSNWKPDEVDKIDPILAKAPEKDTPLGLYYHIPFCRKRCHFCYFRIYTDKKSSEITQYLDATIQELKLYADTPFIEGRPLKFIYFGGGTPSFLTKKQLHDLAAKMQKLLPWDQADEIAFEGEPGTLNKGKLNAIKDMGVTRLSLGIENFDDHILEINGRAHRSAEVYMAYEYARSLNFQQINIDLIAGMLEETEDNWQDTVAKAVDLEPDNVTIYQMEIPMNTTIYRQMREEGKLIAPVASWNQKRAWVDYAFQQFEAAGYTVTSAYTAVKDPEKMKFVYRDQLWSGADMLSLGVASFGHLNGLHYQNLPTFEAYIESVEAGKIPAARSMMTTKEERMVRELILQLKLGKVSIPYFQEKFGTDIREQFKEPLDQLKAEGLLNVSESAVTLERKGLLKVDSFLPKFFLEQHKS